MFDIETKFGTRQLDVIQGDISDLPQKVDLLVISAFQKGYDPVPNTVIGSLDKKGISVAELEKNPLIDLRPNYNAWLSQKQENHPFSYILCLEMERVELDNERLTAIISNIFTVLAVLQVQHDEIIKTLTMPILGSGFQGRNISDMVNIILETFKE